MRYRATITITVELDAATGTMASIAAEQIADTVSFPAPRGRNAEIISIESDYATITNDCEGHPSGPNDPMGQTVYCDGSCVTEVAAMRER